MTRHPSFPCTLGVDYSGGDTYALIGQVRDIEGPSISRNEIEVPPDHDMPNNYMQYFAGIADGGELSFSINLDPNRANHIGAQGTGLLGSFEDLYAGTAIPAWEYVNKGMQGGTATWTFKGFVTAFEPDMGAVEGSMEADVSVKISGKPTLTMT